MGQMSWQESLSGERDRQQVGSFISSKLPYQDTCTKAVFEHVVSPLVGSSVLVPSTDAEFSIRHYSCPAWKAEWTKVIRKEGMQTILYMTQAVFETSHIQRCG